MAITAAAITISAQRTEEVPQGGTQWHINFTSGDVSGQEELRATPGAAKTLILEEFLIMSDDADAHPFLEDASSTIFGPIPTTVEGPVVHVVLEHGIVLTENQALNINATAAGTVAGFVRGRTVNS